MHIAEVSLKVKALISRAVGLRLAPPLGALFDLLSAEFANVEGQGLVGSAKTVPKTVKDTDDNDDNDISEL